ncbi:MAG TPA: SRPBCC family protein [Kofleriaceae bacterium]|nr:SRPBCC family protein [Kofleriaceae bacterium]
MRALFKTAIACLLTLRALPVGAGTGAGIELRDIPGTKSAWQEGTAIIDAPRDEVRRWLTDYAKWPEHFPDITWSQPLGRDDRGRNVVRFHSKIAGSTLTVHEAVGRDLLVFEGVGKHVHTQGRIHLIDLGGNKTRVIMQSTADVQGVAKVFATQRLKRDRAFKVTRAHLNALRSLAESR